MIGISCFRISFRMTIASVADSCPKIVYQEFFYIVQHSDLRTFPSAFIMAATNTSRLDT